MWRFFEKLKRRNLFKVGAAYGVSGWIFVQVADIAADNFGAPPWVMQMLIVVLLLGLPLLVFVSWAQEDGSYGSSRQQAGAQKTRPANKSEAKQVDTFGEDPNVFFDNRFQDAFPGCRELEIIDNPKEAIRRLKILLRPPLSGRHYIDEERPDAIAAPIWWFRGLKSMHIKDFKVVRRFGIVSTREILLNDSQLINVKLIAAFPSSSHRRQSVYLEANPMPATGLSENVTERQNFTDRQVRDYGYGFEEYGVWLGRNITREEYDDSATFVFGRPVSTGGKERRRTRYLTSYNMLLCPQISPINNPKYDQKMGEALNGILRGDLEIQDLYELIKKLPKREFPQLGDYGD